MTTMKQAHPVKIDNVHHCVFATLHESRLLFTILYLLFAIPSLSQKPATYSTNIPVNYIKTWSPQIPVTNPTEVIDPTKKTNEVLLSSQYFDGLGRPLQTVVRKGSQVTGQTTTNDMVSPVVYDALG